jgi:tol-pal system protein YbgF
MIRINTRLTMVPVLAVIMHLNVHAAAAQESGTAVRLAFLDRIFGDSERISPSAPQQPAPQAQAAPQTQALPTTGQGPPMQGRAVQPGSDVEMMMRIDRLEAQIRQLTGVIEQLQHRNQQLESRFGQSAGASAPAAPPRIPQQQAPAAAPQTEMPALPPATSVPNRRGDAFDPSQNPGAPGVPRVLGSIPSSNLPEQHDDEEPVGAPGGRQAGAPLDLSTLAAPGGRPAQPGAGVPGQQLPAPPPRTMSGTGAQVATLPPSDSPRDHFDLAYGYIARKDYALAENGFRGFIQKFPGDRLASDAHYWLGESMFQRQRYRDAAETFLSVSTKYETAGKAPDALLRLGQSLAALGEKEAACASLAEVLRKYPRASVAVRQGVDREQKRVRC